MSVFLLIAITHFFALLTPGPDFLLIVQTAITRSRFLSYLLCIGIALGHLLYLILVFFGMHLLNNVEWMLLAIQVLGIIYLVYLAFDLLESSKHKSLAQPCQNISIQGNTSISGFRIFSEGLGISLLNPKNAVFYASLVSLLGVELSLSIQIFYITWMTSIVLAWDCFIVAMFSRTTVVIFFNRWKSFIQIITASVFGICAISLSLKLIL